MFFVHSLSEAFKMQMRSDFLKEVFEFWKQCIKWKNENDIFKNGFEDGFQNVSDRGCLKSCDF